MLISYAWEIMQISYAWKPGGIFILKILLQADPYDAAMKPRPEKKNTPELLYYAWNSIYSYIMISM
jgi:hypothetical protein